MRKVLGVTVVAAAGLALLACNRTPPRQEVMYAPPPPASYSSDGYAREDGAPTQLPQTHEYAPYGRADVPPQYPQPRSYGGASYGRADVPAPYSQPRSYGGTSYRQAAVPQQYPQPRSYGGTSHGQAAVPPQYPQPRNYGGASHGRAQLQGQEQRLEWKSSPRWATIKSNAKKEVGTGVVKRKAPDKFKLAQQKAAEVGVENLTKEDIEGLDLAQLKQLRGY
jgi:hypothetical protein